MRGAIHAEHGDVGERVVPDDLTRNAVTVGELHVDGPGRSGRAGGLAGRRHDVRVRQHEPVGRDDEPGALRGAGRVVLLVAEEREDRHHPLRA